MLSARVIVQDAECPAWRFSEYFQWMEAVCHGPGPMLMSSELLLAVGFEVRRIRIQE